MKRLYIIFILLLAILILPGCSKNDRVIVGETVIAVEIADIAKEQQKGLMHRESLCDNCGMLFVYKEQQYLSFWMKNTKIPLDIVFIDENFVIRDILKAQPCHSEPCERYSSSTPVQYVLELNQGFSENHTIRVGQTIKYK